jgi:hypothetical protein
MTGVRPERDFCALTGETRFDMTRLILLLLLFSAAMIAVSIIATLLQPNPAVPPRQKKETSMPATFQYIAYALLIALMFGVVTGWLGAA